MTITFAAIKQKDKLDRKHHWTQTGLNNLMRQQIIVAKRTDTEEKEKSNIHKIGVPGEEKNKDTKSIQVIAEKFSEI